MRFLKTVVQNKQILETWSALCGYRINQCKVLFCFVFTLFACYTEYSSVLVQNWKVGGVWKTQQEFSFSLDIQLVFIS